MRVGDNFLKCVVFLGCVKKKNFDVKGTAFLIQHPPGFPYLVTARHVVDAIEQHGSDDGHVYIRANRNDMGATVFRLQQPLWFRHEDDRVDVAVLPAYMGKPDWDHFHFHSTHFITDETLVSEEVGIGNDLFFPGLFSARVGETRNIPICRQGCIAAMPSERIPTRLGQLHGYLIEARSIGGLSGSPVFLNPGVSRGMRGVPMLEIPEKKLHLLGMIHGHYGMGES